MCWKTLTDKNDNLFFNHKEKIYEWVKQIALGASKATWKKKLLNKMNRVVDMCDDVLRVNSIWQHHLNKFS